MRIQIAIITTEFLRDFINDSMRKLDLGFAFSIHPYGSFEDLPDIYRSLPDTAQGVITTGGFVTQILARSFPDTRRIIRTFNNDDADVYKLLLNLMQRHQGLTLDRMFVDPVDVLGTTLQGYVADEMAVSFSTRLDQALALPSLDSLIAMDGYYRAMHLRLWEEKAIDVSVTRFSSIMFALRDAGLRAYFAYPSLAYMGRVCHETMQAVRLQQLRDNQTATILITPGKVDDPEEYRRRIELTHKALIRFSSLTPYDLMPRLTSHGFELLANRKAVSALTEGFRNCRIQSAMKGLLGFPFSVGYGLGETIYQARMNAVDANREAALAQGGSSCLVNERDELIGPLEGGARLVVSRDVSPEVRSVSRRSGLSYITVQKIAAAVRSIGEERVTARELAEKLSITPRSA
ncbi:hypothetical protein LJC23_07750, partial [Desulfovibrio sp. OttesenSCG-928-I05]|nr:hypothetical protein [Desulfovibrio sp. OttesenSCG-928-I05]